MPTLLSQCRFPRRVLQVITPSRMSGAEMQLVHMTPRMIARGHDLATVVKRNSPAIAEMHRLGLAARPARISGKFSALALPALSQAAREHRAEIVQSTLSTASWWSGWLKHSAAHRRSATSKGSLRPSGIAIKRICSPFPMP